MAPELIPVLGSQPAGDLSHKPGGRLPLLSARPVSYPRNPSEGCCQFCWLMNRGTMGVNSLPNTVTRQRRGCDFNPGPSAPESSWSAASVIIDRESDRSTRWIKEAVYIRKEGPRSMNRDEGSYQLSHTYDRFLGSTLTCRAKNRKKKT